MSEERPLPAFVAALGSGSSTPGGGAAAAVAGALAAALAEMVANFTVGRHKFADVDASMRRAVERAEELRGTPAGVDRGRRTRFCRRLRSVQAAEGHGRRARRTRSRDPAGALRRDAAAAGGDAPGLRGDGDRRRGRRGRESQRGQRCRMRGAAGRGCCALRRPQRARQCRAAARRTSGQVPDARPSSSTKRAPPRYASTPWPPFTHACRGKLGADFAEALPPSLD